MILGKLLGVLLGYLWIGGFGGLLVGGLLGHLFDRFVVARARAALRRSGGAFGTGAGVRGGFARGAGGGFGGGFAGGPGGARAGGAPPELDVRAVQQAFFDATFSVMGHVAKADGRVDEREIALAQALMTRLRLDAARRREAIARFDEGKAPDFALDEAVARFVAVAPGQVELFVNFLQIQMQTAMADGEYAPSEAVVLQQIANGLGIPQLVFRQIEMIARMSARANAGGGGPYGYGTAGPGGAGGHGDAGGARAGRSNLPTLAEAYDVLGVPMDADRDTVKNAWRRQMSEHHPDKLASQGLPQEMMDLANERAQAIQRAWESIREAKGWR